MQLKSSRSTCVLSLRGIDPSVSRCAAFELEDVVCAVEGADLLAPRPLPGKGQPSRVLDIIDRRTPWTVTVKPKLDPIRVERDYDLALVVVQTLDDLDHLRLFEGWREKSRTAICYLEEEYRAWISRYTGRNSPLRRLKDFDYVFMNCTGSVDAVHAAVGLPVHYVAPGIDALRFRPRVERRSTDVYYMGRRSQVTHDALVRSLEAGEISYAFDSASLGRVQDVRQHRLLLAGSIQNTRYFIVQKAKAGQLDHTFGQEELGLRYFEGAAGGAVMLGSWPSVETFDAHFDWPDAVIPMDYDCPEIVALIADLDRQPERMERLRRQNVMQSLSRHDWSHRWSTILETVGLPNGEGTARRAAQLEAAMEQVTRLYGANGNV